MHCEQLVLEEHLRQPVEEFELQAEQVPLARRKKPTWHSRQPTVELEHIWHPV
jgi:hypothetical protein